MRALVNQREICNILSNNPSASSVKEAISKQIDCEDKKKVMSYALSLFFHFYQDFYNSCATGNKSEKLDIEREVDLPLAVYLILKGMGFKAHRSEKGLALRGP